MTDELDRRRVLAWVGAGLTVGLAGCSGGSGGTDTATETGGSGGQATDAGTTDEDSTGDATTTMRTPTETLTPMVTETTMSSATTTASGTPAAYEQETRISPGGDGSNTFGGFGDSVALSADGTTAIVGFTEDTNADGDHTGAAYVYELSGGSWSQQAKLIADDAEAQDFFGRSVAMSEDGTTALVGASGSGGTGAVYVFAESDDSWSQQTKLTADDGDSDDRFGNAVALSADGTTGVVGAVRDEDPNGSGQYTRYGGSAYIFSEDGSSWSQQTKLSIDDGDDEDSFGDSVTISSDGTTAIVGALRAGAVYVYGNSGGSWSQQTTLSVDSESIRYGTSVSLSDDGTTAIVGAVDGSNSEGKTSGTAFVYEKSSGSWSEQTELSIDDGGPNDKFGFSVALSDDGTTALIGDNNDNIDSSLKAGSAFVFEESGGSWSQQVKLSADSVDAFASFGDSVALADDATTGLIGSPKEGDTGAAYVFDTS